MLPIITLSLDALKYDFSCKICNIFCYSNLNQLTSLVLKDSPLIFCFSWIEWIYPTPFNSCWFIKWSCVLIDLRVLDSYCLVEYIDAPSIWKSRIIFNNTILYIISTSMGMLYIISMDKNSSTLVSNIIKKLRI